MNCMHYRDVTLTPGLNPHAGILGTSPGQGPYHVSTNWHIAWRDKAKASLFFVYDKQSRLSPMPIIDNHLLIWDGV